MKSTSRVAAAAAILINPRTVMPLAAIVAASLLATFTHLVESAGQTASAAASAPAVQASAPARAASAPAVAASTPQPRAPRPAAVTTTTASADVYYLTPGSSLSAAFGKGWKKVCDASHLRQCGIVRPTDLLIVPADVQIVDGTKLLTRPAQAVVAKRATPQVTTPKATRMVQEQSCIKLGAEPFNPDHNLERALQGIDAMKTLSAEKKEIAKAKVRAGDKATSNELVGRQVFKEMLYQDKKGKLIHVFEKPICDPDNQGGQPEVMDTYDLGDGIQLSIPRRCGNPSWFIRRKSDVPPPVDTPPDDPPLKEPPKEGPPRDDPPPGNPSERPKVVAAPKGICDHLDPSAVLGREHEPEQNGADSHATFLAASLYCLKPFQTADGKTGVHGFGGKVTASEWHGSVNNGVGHYKGWNAHVGPSYKRVMDEGYDGEVSVGVGKQVERYREAAYASQREFDLVGVTVGHNDYRRRLAGETWDVERQYFGALTLPVGKKVGHTLFGQQLADTAELGRFNFGFQAGARWWFYENTDEFPLLPYLQGGVFVQHPTSASMSLRVGVADPDRICGVGIGIDQDLMHGGEPVGAWGWWCDLVKGGQVVRTKVRKHQVITAAAARGITIEAKEGFVQVIRFGEPTK